MQEIAVCGTKGTTTVTEFIYKALRNLTKEPVAHSTTIDKFDGRSQYSIDDVPIFLNKENAQLIQRAKTNKCKYFILETSSLGEKGHRYDCFNWNWGIYTNFSKDHLGKYGHKDIEEYFYYKKHILMRCPNLIINLDDNKSKEIIEAHKKKYQTPSCDSKQASNLITMSCKNNAADYYIRDAHQTRSGYEFCLEHDCSSYVFDISMFGFYDVWNASLAIAFLNQQGFNFRDIAKSIENIRVKGRGEIYANEQKRLILDFAHNELSLRAFFKEVKSRFPNRQIVSITCGQYNYHGRLPGVAKQIAKNCTNVIVTLDECWNENPNHIASLLKKQILSNNNNCSVEIELNRKLALAKADKMANLNNIIVVVPVLYEDYYLFSENKEYYVGDNAIIENLGYKKMYEIN